MVILYEKKIRRKQYGVFDIGLYMYLKMKYNLVINIKYFII